MPYMSCGKCVRFMTIFFLMRVPYFDFYTRNPGISFRSDRNGRNGAHVIREGGEY